jgi:hypothetical protein
MKGVIAQNGFPGAWIGNVDAVKRIIGKAIVNDAIARL